jgi:hypothetical protein
VALNWSTVKAEHVSKACDLLLNGEQLPRSKAKGIFILHANKELPAKHVVRIAYCLANSLPLGTSLKFSSGDGVVNLIRKLGFDVRRTTSGPKAE